ncbi:MAG: ATP phosphoribosyltransferase regulatory subunit [Rhodoferax sp.]
MPSEARHIEELRRELLDTARSYGYELVIPPIFEHLESLLSGAGKALGLQTFQLVDQLSGRMLGLRADSTPQVARIDAHLLNREGVVRLCYCGPVLHTRPASPYASREPLQMGAELYGHAGIEADAEALSLALDCLRSARVADVCVDLADARLVQALLAQHPTTAVQREALYGALAAKDSAELRRLTQGWPARAQQDLLALLQLYGDVAVLNEAEKALQPIPGVREALQTLYQLAQAADTARVSVDLADVQGYAYYTGARFAMYAPAASAALVRGGRYDEVGAVFGRKRPAVGFSLDLKTLVAAVAPRPLRAAIRAPWGVEPALRQAIAALRAGGEVVVCSLPGHDATVDEFLCDRELVHVAGHWLVQAL